MRGEPEKTLEALLKSLDHGEDLENVKGLSFKKGGEVRNNPSRPLLRNIDELPFPARELFPLEKYLAFPLGRMTTVVAALGCPFPCIYCSAHLMDGSVLRARQPLLVADEIEEVVNKYGIKTIFFYADNFTLWNDRNITEFCKELCERKLHIRWLANSRIDTLPSDNALRYMARAGCFLMQFGVESGCLKMIEAMKKARNKEECETYVKGIKPNMRRTKKAGIFTKACMLLGFQGESKETVAESVELIKEAAPDLPTRFYAPVPNPGSSMGKMAEQIGIFPRDGEGLEYDDRKFSLDFYTALNRAPQVRLLELHKFANSAAKFPGIRKAKLLLKILCHFVRRGDWDVLLEIGRVALRENVRVTSLVDKY